MNRTKFLLAALLLAAPAVPTRAEVVAQSDAGFVIKHSVEVAADQQTVWKALVAPAKWWSSDHTWSHDAANLYLDAQGSGCFCEKLPKPADAPADQRIGSVEHMHVLYADPQRGVLRMSGALGPLQGEALNGTLTIELKKTEAGTRIEMEYVVGGYMRMKTEEIAPAVDTVLGQQLTSLAKLFETAPADAAGKPG
jgi:uncharacterized protein YndB with AHSA1/START domain